MFRKFEEKWGMNIPAEPGLPLTKIWDAILRRDVSALYIIGFEPLLSMPSPELVKEALEKAEFVIVQDLFFTETAHFADVVLPAASFAEKEGTFTNLERKIQLLQRAIKPHGASMEDWEILEYPLIMTKSSSRYYQGKLSQEVEGLMCLARENFVEINPKDARDYGIEDGKMVNIISKKGRIKARSRITEDVRPGVVILNYSSEKELNKLFEPILDPLALTPQMRVCAVRITSDDNL